MVSAIHSLYSVLNNLSYKLDKERATEHYKVPFMTLNI